ncbi:MAG: hypothetical protein K9N57_00420 [Candidatus Marinimicrobia bacterium]|nr:hypothetical protein [Candidatus Neomarinimicrobiota bacterium]
MKTPLKPYIKTLVVMCFSLLLLQCSDETKNDVLAPYKGHRALELLKVTQSFTPDIQWLGGRVASAGVNKGGTAALDSTLIWIYTADDDIIGSPVSFSVEPDSDLIQSYGGEPADSLSDGETYTFWIAEKSVFAANLDSSAIDSMNFTDTTMTTALVPRGLSGGGLDLDISLVRDETLLKDKFVLSWTPEDTLVRRIAIRASASGGFQDLIWHVVLPDSVEDSISPPVVLGETPEGANVAVAWPEGGFKEGQVHFIWMVNSNWNNTFSPGAPGYGWFRMFPL